MDYKVLRFLSVSSLLSDTTNRIPIPTYQITLLNKRSTFHFCRFKPIKTHFQKPIIIMASFPLSVDSKPVDEPEESHTEISPKIGSELVDELVNEALVWSSLNGLVVGDRNNEKSGSVPGVGLIHAPTALLPMKFPSDCWLEACELMPIFSELVDRISLDSKFLQDSLSRTKKVDDFARRLLEIHSNMLEINKQEDIRLGLHRSDYMLDAETNQIFQIELNTIASSFPGLSCLVTELHRNLLKHYGKKLGLDPNNVPENTADVKFAEAFAKAWQEYNNSSAAVLFVVQPGERNMYDQHRLSSKLKDLYPFQS